jgi:hypothetical protein
MSDTLPKETTETVEKVDTISHLFEERDRPPLQEDISLSLNATKKQVAPTLSSQPQEVTVETEAAKVDDQAIDNPDLKTLQAELEKNQQFSFYDSSNPSLTKSRKCSHESKRWNRVSDTKF